MGSSPAGGYTQTFFFIIIYIKPLGVIKLIEWNFNIKLLYMYYKLLILYIYFQNGFKHRKKKCIDVWINKINGLK